MLSLLLAQAPVDDVHVGGFAFDTTMLGWFAAILVTIVGIWYCLLRKKPEGTDGQPPSDGPK